MREQSHLWSDSQRNDDPVFGLYLSRRAAQHPRASPVSSATMTSETSSPAMSQQQDDLKPTFRKTTYTVVGADGAGDNEPTQRTRYELTYTVTRPIGAPDAGIFGRSRKEDSASMTFAVPHFSCTNLLTDIVCRHRPRAHS